MHARVMAFAKCRCGHLSATIEMRVCATPRQRAMQHWADENVCPPRLGPGVLSIRGNRDFPCKIDCFR